MFFQSVIVAFFSKHFQWCNKSFINHASRGTSRSYTGSISPQSFLYGRWCIRAVLSRPRPNTSRQQLSRLVTCNSTLFNLKILYLQTSTYTLPRNTLLPRQVCLVSYTIFLRCLPVSQQNTSHFSASILGRKSWNTIATTPNKKYQYAVWVTCFHDLTMVDHIPRGSKYFATETRKNI